MRFKNIFSKQDVEKSKNDVPVNNNMNTENPKAVNDELNEEMSGVESEPKDIPISDENEDTLMSDENVELEESSETETEKSDEELAALHSKIAELKDKYLRLAAEYDNYRKRTLREKTDLIQTAGETLLKDILPVVDDFERGIEVAENAEDMDGVRVGMGLIYNKLKDFLSNNGVKEIDAMNEPFDTDWHEAITNIPAPSDDMKGMIVDVIQKGYTLHNKVIRYPKVVVGE
jgi:molecular chaperone GrpE